MRDAFDRCASEGEGPAQDERARERVCVFSSFYPFHDDAAFFPFASSNFMHFHGVLIKCAGRLIVCDCTNRNRFGGRSLVVVVMVVVVRPLVFFSVFFVHLFVGSFGSFSFSFYQWNYVRKILGNLHCKFARA